MNQRLKKNKKDSGVFGDKLTIIFWIKEFFEKVLAILTKSNS